MASPQEKGTNSLHILKKFWGDFFYAIGTVSSGCHTYIKDVQGWCFYPPPPQTLKPLILPPQNKRLGRP